MLTPLDLLRNAVGGGLGGLMLYLGRSLWDLLTLDLRQFYHRLSKDS